MEVDTDFSNANENNDNQKRKKNSAYGIYPYTTFRQIWEYLMFFMSIVCLWEIPFELVFDIDFRLYRILIALSIDIIYLADIFIIKRTGILQYGIVKLDKKSISNSIPEWKFIIYCFSAVPYYMLGFALKSLFV